MQGQDPSILRPSAWVVRTSKVTVTGKEEWIRLGLEDKDLPRLYNAKDVLEEVAFMYQTGVGVYDREVYATPVIPQLAKNVRTLKDFAQVRGWFAITLGPRKLKELAPVSPGEKEEKSNKKAAATAEGEQKKTKSDGVPAAGDVAGDVDDEDDDDQYGEGFEERMIQEIETMKLEFEQCRQQEQEKFEMEKESLVQQKETELQLARAKWEQEQREREEALRKEWEAKLDDERKRIRDLLDAAKAQLADGNDEAKAALADVASKV